MVESCRALGYAYIAITDHSPSSAASRNLSVDSLQRQADDIARLRERWSDIVILHGCEVDILRDGSLDYSDELLAELEQFGLVTPRAGTGHFDTDALVIATTARELAEFGLEPRHLRVFRTAADREVGLVEQVVSPMRGGRDGGSRARADEAAREIGQVIEGLTTAPVLRDLARRLGIELPITEGVCRVLGGESLDGLLASLMGRQPTAE
jgi:hypothetical protein